MGAIYFMLYVYGIHSRVYCTFHLGPSWSWLHGRWIYKNTERTATNGQSRENWQQDEDKQNKNTIQYVLDTTMRKQSQIT
jgi:hypothetical protein